MKKKVIIFVLFLLLSFFVLHLRQIGNFYYNTLWNIAYQQWDFTGALDTYTKAQGFLPSPETLYNIADTKYKLWDYEGAKTLFEVLTTLPLYKKTLFQTFHNLGNTFYQIWKKKASIQDTIESYEESIWAYLKALDIENNTQTRENKEFVQKELDTLKEKEKQEEEKKDTWTWSAWEPSAQEKEGEHDGRSVRAWSRAATRRKVCRRFDGQQPNGCAD